MPLSLIFILLILFGIIGHFWTAPTLITWLLLYSGVSYLLSILSSIFSVPLIVFKDFKLSTEFFSDISTVFLTGVFSSTSKS